MTWEPSTAPFLIAMLGSDRFATNGRLLSLPLPLFRHRNIMGSCHGGWNTRPVQGPMGPLEGRTEGTWRPLVKLLMARRPAFNVSLLSGTAVSQHSHMKMRFRSRYNQDVLRLWEESKIRIVRP